MPPFSDFDARRYRTVDVRTGYAEWVASYEQTVQDTMDVALLERLSSIDWGRVRLAADLGCGTGRTGAWLAQRGVGTIDGVDLTPEMLVVARDKGLYRGLVEADLAATGLPSAAYDLVSACLVDEHLPEVQPLYREAFRLARPAGWLVLVGYHPQFIMAAGMPTHYTSRSGEQVAIDTHLHLLSDHVTAGLQAGWTLREMKERVIDESYLAHKPKWARFRNQPIAFAFAWHKEGDMMPSKEIVSMSTEAGNPNLSPATRFGNLVFVAGQTGRNPETGEVGRDIREQTRNVLERIKLVLEAAGTSMDNVLTATTYLTNRDNLAAYNEEYARYFPTNKPARTTVTVASLNAPELLIEITVTACVPT